MLLKSQLLFINYRRVLQYTFCTPKAIITKLPQQQDARIHMRKQTHIFFKKCKDHEKIFKEEGLLNFNSVKIKELFEEKTIDTIKKAKNWLSGMIQVDSVDATMFDNYLNFQIYLIKEKDNYPQIQQMITKRDLKTMNSLLYSSKKMVVVARKIVDFVIYCHKSKQQNYIEMFKDKIIKSIQDQSQKSNILKEVFKDNQITDEFKKQFIEKLTINSNISVLIDASIPLSFIPQKMMKSQRKILFQALRQRIQNQLNLNQLILLYKELLQLKYDQQQISMIIMILNKFIRRIRDKKDCVKIDGAQFIKIILQNQQTGLLFYYLIINKSDSPLSNFIDLKQYRPFAQQNWLTKFLLCILVHKRQKNLEEQAIKVVSPAFKDLSTFLSIYQSMRMIHLDQFFPQISSYFITQIIALPNPFLDRGHYTIRQKSLYIEFFLRSFHYNDHHKLINLCKDNITYDIKKEAIKYHLEQVCQLQPVKYYIYFVNQVFDIAVSRLDKEFLGLGIELLRKYQKIGVERTENQYSELKFWKLFKNYIENINVIISLGLGEQIIDVFKSFIQNNYKYYKQDYHYRQLLKSLLNNLKSFQSNPRFMSLIIKQALKYPSILNPLVLKDIKITHDTMNSQQYKKYLTVIGQKSGLDLLNEKNLSILFMNQTYSSQIKLHKTKILNIINCANMSSCIEAINCFGMIPNKDNTEILKVLLNRIINDSSPTDLKGKIDLIGLFLNCLKNQQFFMVQFNKIWHLIIKTYLNDTEELTIKMHIFLIQFGFTQSPNKIEHVLFHSYIKNIIKALNRNIVAYQSTELLLFYEIARLSQITTFMKNTNKVKRLMRRSDLYHSKLKGTSLFILFQENLQENEREEQINKMYEYHKRQLSSNNKYQPFIYDLHYAYIKNKYGKKAANLNLSQEHLKPYLFTMEYKIDSFFLKELMHELKTPLEYSLKFGANNIIQLNDFFLVFLHPYKNSCKGQQKSIANIIQSIHGKSCKVIFFIYYGHQTYQMEILKTLSQHENLLSKQSYEKLKSRIKQRKSVQNQTNIPYSYNDFVPEQGFQIGSLEYDDKDSESQIGSQY